MRRVYPYTDSRAAAWPEPFVSHSRSPPWAPASAASGAHGRSTVSCLGDERLSSRRLSLRVHYGRVGVLSWLSHLLVWLVRSDRRGSGHPLTGG